MEGIARPVISKRTYQGISVEIPVLRINANLDELKAEIERAEKRGDKVVSIEINQEARIAGENSKIAGKEYHNFLLRTWKPSKVAA